MIILSGFDDSSWDNVNAPHDFLIESGNFSSSNREENAFLPRNVSWYRKHFNLPTDWKGARSIFVRFEGSFHHTSAYINGEKAADHQQGYVPFYVRLDNATELYFGDGTANENVLALFVDAMETSSWWYAGGGLYTDVSIVASSPLHVDFDGVDAWSKVSETSIQVDEHLSGPGRSVLRAGSASIGASIDVTLDANSSVSGFDSAQKAAVKVEVIDASGSVVASGTTDEVTVLPGALVTASASLNVPSARLWSVQDPYLYTMRATVLRGGASGVAVDSVDTYVGVRSVEFDANSGFALNGQKFQHLGFCDHDNFGGVGMAVPARVNLYRMQMIRAVGGNARRTSHNAPVPPVLDFADRLGILMMDEHRNYRDGDEYYKAFRDLLRRDRHRASVMLMSWCNEVGCSTDSTIADTMKKLMSEFAPHVISTANMIGNYGDEESKDIDVQGFSHKSGSTFDQFHKQYPSKPTIASECCSCQQDRGEMWPDKNHEGQYDGGCVAGQTTSVLDLNYTSGSYTWTLFGYYGEGHSFPRASSSYGYFDLSGFAKPQAHLYRHWWLQNRNGSTDHGVPPLQYETSSVRIVDFWPENSTHPTRSVTVLAQGVATVQLLLNDKEIGNATAGTSISHGSVGFGNIAFEAGNLTAVGLDASGNVLDTHTRMTAGKPARIELQLDAPVPRTGTGTGKMVSDGTDVGMVRATVVDANGVQVWGASNMVTFEVSSGPAVIYGVDNGDPASLEPPKSTSRSAYHGLVRAIVRSTEISATPAWHRQRLLQLHGGKADVGAGIRIAAVNGDVSGLPEAATEVIVSASAPGLEGAKLTIPLSSDAETDGVLASASKFSVGVPLSLD